MKQIEIVGRQVWLYRHVPVALYLRLAPQKLITETATEALALVAILSLQLNECLRVACSVGFDVVLLPMLGDGILLCLALCSVLNKLTKFEFNL